MTGDTVNLASRLESLNKYLRTQVLLSDAVRVQLGDRFITRRMGEFRVAGRSRSVILHELYCAREDGNGDWSWIKVFEEGVEQFRQRNFSEASETMECALQMRAGKDGPAEFYLRQIARLKTSDADGWDGVVELSEK
jgi:adenylate cyclase